MRSGDFNLDGDFACQDVDTLTTAISQGAISTTLDLNVDERLDQEDLLTWLTEAGARELASGQPYLLGDADLNGNVDGSDFSIWNTNMFTEQSRFCSGDFNADGFVDGSDFSIWNIQKLQSPLSSTLVPEPQIWAGVVLVLVAALESSRRGGGQWSI